MRSLCSLNFLRKRTEWNILKVHTYQKFWFFFFTPFSLFFYDLFGLTWKYVPYMYNYLIHSEPDCVADVADLFQTMNHLIAEQNSQSLVSPTCINDKKYPECS